MNYPEQVVGAGSCGIEVAVSLPDRYELSDVAPFYVAFSCDDAHVIRLTADSTELTIDTPVFPVKLPAVFSAGETVLTVEINAYYCESGNKLLCRVAQLCVEVPVTVCADRPAEPVQVRVPITVGTY